MKKNGFSLAELLITLSIIAVAAAIAVPALNKLSPDKYKARVLKNYVAVDTATAELLSNENIYYRKNPSTASSNDTEADGSFKTDTQFGCIGLFCTEQPAASTGYNSSDYEGICKYPNLMLEKLQLTNATMCTGSSGTARGMSSDKTLWDISANNLSDINEGYTILIDLDESDNSTNCSYKKDGNNECKYPDRFMFNVSIDGEVTASPDDKLTEVYLKNMTRTDRQADFDEAAR